MPELQIQLTIHGSNEKSQIRQRYQDGTMGYESCIQYLTKYFGMSEQEADDYLLDTGCIMMI